MVRLYYYNQRIHPKIQPICLRYLVVEPDLLFESLSGQVPNFFVHTFNTFLQRAQPILMHPENSRGFQLFGTVEWFLKSIIDIYTYILYTYCILTPRGLRSPSSNDGERKPPGIFHFEAWFDRVNTGYITGLDMFEVCTEALHSVALWTRVTSLLWTCLKYVPKQSIA